MLSLWTIQDDWVSKLWSMWEKKKRKGKNFKSSLHRDKFQGVPGMTHLVVKAISGERERRKKNAGKKEWKKEGGGWGSVSHRGQPDAPFYVSASYAWNY